MTIVFALFASACVSLSGSAEDDATGGPEIRLPNRSREEPSTESDVVACASGKKACGGACVDLATDPDNCGRCGHGCLGGACVEAKCQPVTLATGLNLPQGIAVGPDAVYVAVQNENRIVRIPKGGGAAEIVTTSTTSPWGIAASFDGPTRLVWGEARGAASNVVMCEVPCEAPKKIPAGADVWQIAIAGELAYYSTSSQSAGSIRRSRLDGFSTTFDVVTNLPNAYGLAVSGGTLAFGVRSARGVVRRASTSGNGVTDLITGLDGPKALATDGTNVFVAVAGSNVIARCPLTGCEVGEQATFALANNPHGVATDGTSVYWSNGLAHGGSVRWCPTDACSGSGHVLAAEQANPYAIVLDDEAVYWTNAAPNGQVMKIARP
jgi:glucose/arabinose dehydrogenase